MVRWNISERVMSVSLIRGSRMVHTVNTMMFTNSSAIIGFITSVAVNLMRLNLAALCIIFLMRLVLVNLSQ